MKLGASSCRIQSWALGPRAGKSPSRGPTVRSKAGEDLGRSLPTQGPSHRQPPAPHLPEGPDVQFDVNTYRPTLSLPTALPLTVILLAPEIGGGGGGAVM